MGGGLSGQSMGDEGCGTNMARPHCLIFIRPVEWTAPTVSQRAAIDNKEVEGTSGNYASTTEHEQCWELLGRSTNNSSRRETV